MPIAGVTRNWWSEDPINWWRGYATTEAAPYMATSEEPINWWRSYAKTETPYMVPSEDPIDWWRGYATTGAPHIATTTTEVPEETALWEYVLRAVLFVIQGIGQFEVEHLTLTLFVVTLLCVSSFVICFLTLCKAFKNRKSKKLGSQIQTPVGYIQPIYVNHSSGELSLNGAPNCNCTKWAGDHDSVPKSGRDIAGKNWEQECVKQLENWEMEKDVLRL